MIGDLTVDAKLNFSKLGGLFFLGDLGLKLGVRGKYAVQAREIATTGDQTLDTSGFAVLGYVAFKNVNPPLCGTPAAPQVIPVGPTGASPYAYKVVAKQLDGGYTVASPAGTISNGFASLDNSHYNAIIFKLVDDAVSYDIYRTQGGGAHGLGFIQTVVSPTAIAYDNGIDATGVATGPLTTPFDYSILIGPTSGSYTILLKGADMFLGRWNAAAIHYKSVMNSADFTYLIIDE
jgi:hypothetical protein